MVGRGSLPTDYPNLFNSPSKLSSREYRAYLNQKCRIGDETHVKSFKHVSSPEMLWYGVRWPRRPGVCRSHLELWTVFHGHKKKTMDKTLYDGAHDMKYYHYLQELRSRDINVPHRNIYEQLKKYVIEVLFESANLPFSWWLYAIFTWPSGSKSTRILHWDFTSIK